jgi:hypothetical protein
VYIIAGPHQFPEQCDLHNTHFQPEHVSSIQRQIRNSECPSVKIRRSIMDTQPTAKALVSTSIDRSRASFSAGDSSIGCLPPGVRNQIYSMVLLFDEPIHVVPGPKQHPAQFPHNDDFSPGSYTCHGTVLTSPSEDGLHPFAALHLLGSLNRQIRHEARTYYFVYNKFKVVAARYSDRREDPLNFYNRFIGGIGLLARSRLTSLNLQMYSDGDHYKTNFYKANFYKADFSAFKSFIHNLAECPNLKKLELTIDADYLWNHDFVAVTRFIRECGPEPAHPSQAVLQTLENLPGLEHFNLCCVFRHRAQCIYTTIYDLFPWDTRQLHHNFSVHQLRLTDRPPKKQPVEILLKQLQQHIENIFEHRDTVSFSICSRTTGRYAPITDRFMLRRPTGPNGIEQDLRYMP